MYRLNILLSSQYASSNLNADTLEQEDAYLLFVLRALAPKLKLSLGLAKITTHVAGEHDGIGHTGALGTFTFDRNKFTSIRDDSFIGPLVDLDGVLINESILENNAYNKDSICTEELLYVHRDWQPNWERFNYQVRRPFISHTTTDCLTFFKD